MSSNGSTTNGAIKTNGMAHHDVTTAADTASQAPGRFHETPNEHIYDGKCYPGCFPASVFDRLKTTDFRDDDVIVATYPKAGTTWVKEIVRLVQADGDREGKAKPVRMLELSVPQHTTLDAIEGFPSPRTLATHAHRYMLDNTLQTKKTKFVVVMRGIKDNLVSFYHFYKKAPQMGGFTGTFSEFLQMNKATRLTSGSWFDFNFGWWEERDNPNVMFTTYETISKDTRAFVRQVADFVGKTLDDETLDIICKKVSFETMSSSAKVMAIHTRKGVVGDWQSEFTPEQAQEIDSEYEEKMKNSDLRLLFGDS